MQKKINVNNLQMFDNQYLYV